MCWARGSGSWGQINQVSAHSQGAPLDPFTPTENLTEIYRIEMLVWSFRMRRLPIWRKNMPKLALPAIFLVSGQIWSFEKNFKILTISGLNRDRIEWAKCGGAPIGSRHKGTDRSNWNLARRLGNLSRASTRILQSRNFVPKVIG